MSWSNDPDTDSHSPPTGKIAVESLDEVSDAHWSLTSDSHRWQQETSGVRSQDFCPIWGAKTVAKEV